MGVLDLPGPLLNGLDHVLGLVAPASVRLALWSALGGALSMALYRVLSPQKRLAELEAKAAEARRALDAHEGEFAEAWPLIGQMLRLSLRRLRLVLWPALAAAVPMIALLVWLSTAFGHQFPPQGASVGAVAHPGTITARFVPAGGGMPEEGGSQALPRVLAVDGDDRPVADMPLTAPVTTLHKRLWWNVLIGNPAGYLPDDGPAERIDLDLPKRQYLPFGPDWLRGWETLFLAAALLSSIAIKMAFRIR